MLVYRSLLSFTSKIVSTILSSQNFFLLLREHSLKCVDWFIWLDWFADCRDVIAVIAVAVAVVVAVVVADADAG